MIQSCDAHILRITIYKRKFLPLILQVGSIPLHAAVSWQVRVWAPDKVKPVLQVYVVTELKWVSSEHVTDPFVGSDKL